MQQTRSRQDGRAWTGWKPRRLACRNWTWNWKELEPGEEGTRRGPCTLQCTAHQTYLQLLRASVMLEPPRCDRVRQSAVTNSPRRVRAGVSPELAEARSGTGTGQRRSPRQGHGCGTDTDTEMDLQYTTPQEQRQGPTGDGQETELQTTGTSYVWLQRKKGENTVDLLRGCAVISTSLPRPAPVRCLQGIDGVSRPSSRSPPTSSYSLCKRKFGTTATSKTR